MFFDSKKGYKLFTNDLGFAYGEIEINKAGNGFIHTKDGYTIFIAKEDLNGAVKLIFQPAEEFPAADNNL